MRRVSVILCCANGATSVSRALTSLYRQTFPLERYEVVFINDGSTDDTERLALAFARHRNFRYVKHPTNLGLPASCNRGLREARGRYVIRLDADDTFDRTILAEMCGPLDRGETDFVSCDRRERIGDGSETREVRIEPFDVFRLIAIGTMMRRDLLLAIGGYRNLFWEEYDVYLRYLRRSRKPPVHIPKALLTYTRREGSLSADVRRRRAGWAELRRLWPREIAPGVPPRLTRSVR